MKASDLIKLLQAYVKKYGDKKVFWGMKEIRKIFVCDFVEKENETFILGE